MSKRAHDWRYLPTRVIVHVGPRFLECPVIAYRAYPPGQHPPATPIVPHMTAVEMVTHVGKSSWVGVDAASPTSATPLITRLRSRCPEV